MAEPPIVVGVSGASGAPIAIRVLQALHDAHVPVSLVVSDGAATVLREECDLAPEALRSWAEQSYSDHDLGAPIASGSVPTRGMVVVPCSSNTVAKIALGLGDTLLSTTLLRHLTTLSELGAVVLVASPAYYLRPKSVAETTDYLAGKVLDHLGIAHRLYRGWKTGTA